MRRDLAKIYLSDYIKNTGSLFDSYLQKNIDEAKKIGLLPADLLKKFSETAKKGKKIRGALIVLGYQLAGGMDIESIYDASLFIELFHTGVLVHDDIMDEAEFRRGIPTIPKQYEKFGQNTAESLGICVGDLAFYLSWNKLLNSNFQPDRLVKVSKIYADHAINLVHGQVLDVTNSFAINSAEDNIFNIFKYKTAEYTGVLPLLVGATLAGMENKSKLAALKEYGLCLGWAFQIHDDILGLFGNETDTGKPADSDLKEGKVTLFIHFVFKNGSEEQKKYLKTILGNKNLREKDIIKVRSFFNKIGALKYVKDLERHYIEKGRKAIPKITNDQNLQNLLDSLLEFIIKRSK